VNNNNRRYGFKGFKIQGILDGICGANSFGAGAAQKCAAPLCRATRVGRRSATDAGGTCYHSLSTEPEPGGRRSATAPFLPSRLVAEVQGRPHHPRRNGLLSRTVLDGVRWVLARGERTLCHVRWLVAVYDCRDGVQV